MRIGGVAPVAVDLRQPSAGAFAQALDFAASAQVRDRAHGLGEMMRAENGVVDAVVFLERIVARSQDALLGKRSGCAAAKLEEGERK